MKQPNVPEPPPPPAPPEKPPEPVKIGNDQSSALKRRRTGTRGLQIGLGIPGAGGTDRSGLSIPGV